jgi:hypothetical protein
VGELDRSLNQDLQQRNRKPRPLHDDVFDFRRGPGHQLRVFERRGLFRAVRQIQKRRFPEELVRLINVHYHLVAIVRQARYFHFAVNHEINCGGRLILVIDHLSFSILHNAGARQMR